MSHCLFQSIYPEHLLDRYIIINSNHEHKVSSYKLAKFSSFFKSCIKTLRRKEIEKYLVHEIELDRRYDGRKFRRPYMTDIKNEKIRINYEDTDGLEYALSFVHCMEEGTLKRNLVLNDILVISVLHAASYLKMPTLLKHCCKYVKANICSENCWQFWETAMTLNSDYEDLVNVVLTYVYANFMDVCLSEKFLKLPHCDIKKFLKNDKLNCPEEVNLIDLVIKWVSFDLNGRLSYFPKLIKCVRLSLLKESQIEKLLKNDYGGNVWFKSNMMLSWILENFKNKQTSSIISSGDSEESANRIKNPRLPHEAIYVVGGWEGRQEEPDFGPSHAVQIYNPRTDIWTRHTSGNFALNEGHAYSGCVTLHNKIYLIGGHVASGPTQALKMYDFSVQKWKYLSPMHEKRNYVSVCLFQEFIYAIGGHNGRIRLCSVEKYDPEENKWTFVAPMKQVRSDAGADTLHDKIYVCGGFNGESFYSTVEMYNPKCDQWTFVAPMTCMRSGVSAVSLGNFLYAIGGNNGRNRLRTVERYDPKIDEWQTMPCMIGQRSNFCTRVLENNIYAMGGWTDGDNSTIASVERWNPESANKWENVRSLYMPASAMCCCVVKGVDIIKQHIRSM